MAVESATYINGLNASLPNANDEISEGDDHIRLIKNVLKNTFPNISAAVNASAAEMDTLVGLVISSYMRTLLDDADAATARTTLGAMASVSPGTSGNVLTSNGSAWVSAAAKWLATSTQSLSSGYTVVAGDAGKVFDCSGTFTLALTAAATLGSGFVVGVRNSGSGTITIDPNGSETVDGQTTIALSPDQSCILVCTGSAWITLGRQSGGVVNVQTFSTSGTWYKPTVGTVAMIECWGGGGSGAKVTASDGAAGGGGGGNYVMVIKQLSSLNSTESVTVGAGGAARTTNGSNNGQNTTFGAHVTAHGGAGGGSNGGGGGAFGGGVFGRYGGGNGGRAFGDHPQHYAEGSTFGGGGGSGAYASDGNISITSAGGSMFGGAGGGGAGGSNGFYSSTIGAVSLYGGNGGNGATNTNASSGATPGGGGGGCVSSSGSHASGAGGNGYCRVTVF